jgi:hypothetical protein
MKTPRPSSCWLAAAAPASRAPGTSSSSPSATTPCSAARWRMHGLRAARHRGHHGAAAGAVHAHAGARRDVVVLSDAEARRGVGFTIARGVSERPAASGWLVLPGDMPLVRPASIPRWPLRCPSTRWRFRSTAAGAATRWVSRPSCTRSWCARRRRRRAPAGRALSPARGRRRRPRRAASTSTPRRPGGSARAARRGRAAAPRLSAPAALRPSSTRPFRPARGAGPAASGARSRGRARRGGQRLRGVGQVVQRAAVAAACMAEDVQQLLVGQARQAGLAAAGEREGQRRTGPWACGKAAKRGS